MNISNFSFSKICACFLAAILLSTAPFFDTALAEPANQEKLLEKSIGESQRELAIAVRDYEETMTKMERSSQNVKELAKQVDASNRQLAEAKNIFNRRLASFYKTGTMSFIEYLFSATTPGQFSTRMDMMMRIGEQDAALIKEIENLQIDLDNRLKILGEKYRSQQTNAKILKQKQGRIETQLAIEQQRLDRVKEMGAIDAKMMASLPPSRIVPSRDMDVPESRSVGELPIVFPIAGAHAYQNTWGAPRSGGRHHQGTDIFANRGIPCVAVRDGVISTIDYHGLAGKYIRMVDADGNMYAYIHLDDYAGSAFPGKPVKQGEVIGYVGNTGNASGGACHLHFEFHPGGGEPVNPYPYLINCDN